ncbi:MAG: thiamine-binding protein [Dehalococcoidia bacterium]|nr:thiamine-binding protein [Dehalococcoidia bacterium]
MIMEIECLANPPGTPDSKYAHVEAAIAVIQQSGLPYEVDALGTTVEGDPDAIWALGRAVHEACLNAGADSVVSVVKFAQSRDAATGATMASLTGKFR